MTHDRDPGGDHGPYLINHVGAPLYLNGRGPALFEKPASIPDPLLNRGLIGKEWHVAYHESMCDSPAAHPSRIDHLIHGYRDRRRVALDDRAKGIAHKDDI